MSNILVHGIALRKSTHKKVEEPSSREPFQTFLEELEELWSWSSTIKFKIG
jgi:hypothetical protein